MLTLLILGDPSGARPENLVLRPKSPNSAKIGE
jgi:hypothetical protein